MNKILNNDCDICLELYNRMIDKVEDISKLPHMKEQKITDITSFTEAFTVERKNKSESRIQETSSCLVTRALVSNVPVMQQRP